jgi:hypothetical protein
MKKEQNKTIHTQRIDYEKWRQEENARYEARLDLEAKQKAKRNRKSI